MFSEFSYRKLRVYKQSKDLVVYIYGLIRHFPKEENFALCDQLRRAAISIPSNIAEGMGRNSYKEQIHFLEISYGSLNEVMCQIEIAYELRFVTLEQLQKVEELYRGIAQMLSGLRKSRMSTFNSDWLYLAITYFAHRSTFNVNRLSGTLDHRIETLFSYSF